jgi:1,4-dihydroxy-2-naphthoate octaprenyltransferase
MEKRMLKHWKPLLGVMRLPFVILAPACTLVGVGTAYWTTGSVHVPSALLAVLGALAAHISVNVFNEYLDFRNGLDGQTRRTPFSGGSGTLQARPDLAPAALALAIVAAAVTGGIGMVFAFTRGWGIIPLGIIGMFLLYGYTAWMVYQPVLCLLAPGIGFGPLTVLGTHFALTGQYSLTAAVASLVPLFLVSNVLLLNQFPDAEADERVGRRHFPILIGRRRSARIYAAFLIATYVVVAVGVLAGVLPPFSALALLTSILAIQAIRGALHNADNIPALMPSLGQNVLISLITPVLLTVGAFIR